MFQIGDPVSIDIVERASRMAGTLAYEVRGAIEDAHEVYNALYEAGKPLGVRRLGSHCYPMFHLNLDGEK